MSRRLWLAMLVLALAAAAPSLPLPPTPPPGGPPDRSAPTPDSGAQQPTEQQMQRAEVTPDWFTQRDYNNAEGFTPGSQIDNRPYAHVTIAPEINLKVPLK